jgi:polysaccharide export outer membrane protein
MKKKRLLLSLLTIAICTVLFSCSSLPPPPETAQKKEFRFTLGPGDKIEIDVRKNEDLKREIVVGPDGRIEYPFIGTINVKGATIRQLSLFLANKLKDYIKNPVVTVTIQQFGSSSVHVMGEVKSPGTYAYLEGMSVMDAIQRAGSFNPVTAAFWDTHLVRGRLDKPEAYRVDVEEVLVARQKDVQLQPGDIVYVPPRWITSFDRYVTQLLSPVRQITGAAREAAWASSGGW